jgi:hypothetical protein
MVLLIKNKRGQATFIKFKVACPLFSFFSNELKEDVIFN